MEFRAFFVGHTPLSLLPSHLHPSLKTLIHDVQPLTSLAIVCNTASLKGEVDLRVTSKMSVRADILSHGQLQQLQRMAALKSGKHVISHVDVTWTWLRVRQELCNHFGSCVQLLHTPCDILGNTTAKIIGTKGTAAKKTLAGEATSQQKSANKSGDKSGGSQSLTVVIDQERRWKEAVREVVSIYTYIYLYTYI